MTHTLVLLSEYERRMNTETSDKDPEPTVPPQRRRELIAAASAAFTTEADERRFDRFYDTRYFTPFSMENGGDLLNAYELILDADLQTVDVLTNGDGTTVTSDQYKLWPYNVTEKSIVRLNPNGTAVWEGPTTDDYGGSISLAGFYGYGGSFASTGDTIQDSPLTANATTIDVTDGDNFEVEMMLSIANATSGNTEYVRVTSISTNTLTVTRGYNGTTAEEQAQNTVLDYFVADDLVREKVIRLTSWMIDQHKSPLFGLVSIGDIGIPVVVDTMPADVRATAQQLRRPMRVIAA
jgi:hypothetical protein